MSGMNKVSMRGITEKRMNIKKERDKLVPKLRFPEFRDADGWEETSLNALGDIISGLTYSPNDVRESGLLVLRSTNVQNGEIVLSDCIYVTSTIKGANLSKPNDILICVRNGSKALIGKNALVPEGIPLSTHGAFMTVFRSSSAKFVHQLFQTESYNRQVSADLGATINSINTSQLSKYKFYIPNLGERQKVADCLSSLDDLIATQSQKLDALNAHKIGLMQQLFPADGETVPKLRFPEFRETGSWVVENLGEVYSFKVTNSFSRDKLNYQDGLVKNIHYGDIHTKFAALFDIGKERVPFINPNVSIQNIKAECYCVEGDIVFADASEDIQDVGKSIEIIHLNNEKLVAGLHTLLARQKKSKLVVGFGGHLFNTKSIRSQIQRQAHGTKVLGISSGRLSGIKLVYPQDKKEQQKITDCLSFFDDLITAQAQHLDGLKSHKKGLMQQLFPSLNNFDK